MTELILEKSHISWIIIGDNSRGKSELLKSVITSKGIGTYFIDSVNRGFDLSNVNLTDQEIRHNLTVKEIVEQRIDSSNHNLNDSLGLNEHIERIFPLFSRRLYVMLSEFLNTTFEIRKGNLESGIYLGNVAVADDKEIELSSGYQAIFRLFAEIILCCECLNGVTCVVIDEIDEFLSPRHSARVLEFLKEQYEQVTFIVSTHSPDLIANTNDCNVLVIEEGNYGVLESNDFNSLTSVNTLFNDIYSNSVKTLNTVVDEVLQRLFEHKIIDSWGANEESEFEKMIYSDLTPTQKVIYKQIREW